MKQSFISRKNGNKALIIIFLGWAADESLLKGLSRHSYDIMAVWDYRSPDFDPSKIQKYKEIVVVGWSFGVNFADRFIRNNPVLPITKCIAVNGSPRPIDDNLGIPLDIFAKTAQLPDQRALDKFYTRICGGARARTQLMPEPPQRDVDELRDELNLIHRFVEENPTPTDLSVWDRVIISGRDLIFSTDNLLSAWDNVGVRVVTFEEEPHLPDFQYIIDTFIIDKSAPKQNFKAARKTYNDNAVVQRRVALDLYSMSPHGKERYRHVLEVGSGTGLLTDLYIQNLYTSTVHLLDFSPKTIAHCPVGVDVVANRVDAELQLMEYPDSIFDRVYSASCIQWFNSPLKALRNIYRILCPEGVAAIAYFDHENLTELMPYAPTLDTPPIEINDLEHIGFTVEKFERKKYSIDFDSPIEALRHLRDTGVTGFGSKPVSPGPIRELMREISSPDGRASLCYSVTYLILHK